jgi:outer membrane protein OmpA-like peptidoglycan-associated protein
LKSQQLLSQALEIDKTDPNIREAQLLFEMGVEFERQRDFSASARSYKDSIVLCEKIVGNRRDLRIDDVEKLEPKEFREVKELAQPLKNPVTAIKTPPRPTPSPKELSASHVASSPASAVPPKPVPVPSPAVVASKPSAAPAASPKPKMPAAERRFPEARKIEDLKREGIADLSRTKPVPAKANVEAPVDPDLGLLFKEKFPGVISYSFSEIEFQSSSMATLTKVIEKLKSDKKAKMMFQAQLGQGENFQLTDERFERLAAYLESKGVDEARISLDDKRLVGDWPEIRIFILH